MAWLALAVGGAALVHRGLHEPIDFGYVRYVGIADEMIRRGDWVVQHLGDALYLDKPPLFMWMLAAPMSWFGSKAAWVGHLPDLGALLLAAACTWRLGRVSFGSRTGAMASVLVFVTLWETFASTVGKRLDPVFSALLTASFTAFFEAARSGAPAPVREYLVAAAWVALALAMLVKGPLALAFFALVMVPWAAWSGRLRAFLSRGNAVGIALALLLLSAWPFLLVQELGLETVRQELSRTAFTTRTGGLLHYVQSVPVMMIPWSIYLPALVLWLPLGRPWRGSEGLRLALLWFGLLFAVLHFAEAKHQRYLQPALPALSLLLVSLWLAPGGRRAVPGRGVRWLRDLATWLALVAVAFAGLVAGPGLLLLETVPVMGMPMPPEAVAAGPLALGLGLMALWFLVSGRGRQAVRASPLPFGVLVVGVAAVIHLVAVGDLRRQDPLPAAEEALALAGPDASIALFRPQLGQLQMLRLVSGRTLPQFTAPDALVAWEGAQPERPAWVLTTPDGRRALEGELGHRLPVARDLEIAEGPVQLLRLERP